MPSGHTPLGSRAAWACRSSPAMPRLLPLAERRQPSHSPPWPRSLNWARSVASHWGPGALGIRWRGTGAPWGVLHDRRPHRSSIRAACLGPFHVRFHLQRGFPGLKEVLKSSGRMISEDPSRAVTLYGGLIIRWLLPVGGASCTVSEVCACVPVCVWFL